MKKMHEDIEAKEKLSAIRKFVLEERARRGITKLHGPLMELSCIAYGETRNLLWRKLFHTSEKLWNELADPEMLDGVYKEVLTISEKRKSPGA